MSKKSKVSFTQPPEPAFILRMKEQIGWKEGPTVDTKREELESADDPDYERVELEDEKPVVVALRAGDLTAEEADDIQRDLELDDKTPGKFRFRKPIGKPDTSKASDKRVQTAFSSSRIKRRSHDQLLTGVQKSSRVSPPHTGTGPEKASTSVNQRSLLSFGDEDEDDG